jgi:Recombinase/Recombinase zinc beta ribbon domain
LQLNEDKTGFVKIPDRCAKIERIFKLSRFGTGAESIARTLNKENGSWIPKNGWRKSYVNKILRNRAVMGEFQPHTGSVSGDRRPTGEPIKNYYPAIIPDKLFHSVQRTGERVIGGRNGKINTLFGGFAKCGYCGGPMRFVDKGKPPKGGSYLVCDNAARGITTAIHGVMMRSRTSS